MTNLTIFNGDTRALPSPLHGGDGPEESFKFDGSFTNGQASVVSVTLQGSKYLIAINGNLRYTYTQRINAPVRGLKYEGLVGMTTVMFGDFVDAMVVGTLPPPNPSESFSLHVGDTHSLSSAVANGQFVYFVSSTITLAPELGPGGDNTTLNLLSASGDYLLHIAFRRPDNTINFNARGVTSPWGTQETISSQGFFHEGQPVSVVVQNKSSTFDIYVNETACYTFKKRSNQAIWAISYTKNPGQLTPIFADIINAAIAGN
ncbi:hypothetical protein GQX73_g2796 [Xylaria multiplex]|uniref:Galectin n=1 Tax=Xylaria multiplex TaxID=323545 RepID=A0A7C8IRX5_9PEZI|nr:hypothetical protein GQX73_g2796 [Xylaria multiplex]